MTIQLDLPALPDLAIGQWIAVGAVVWYLVAAIAIRRMARQGGLLELGPDDFAECVVLGFIWSLSPVLGPPLIVVLLLGYLAKWLLAPGRKNDT